MQMLTSDVFTLSVPDGWRAERVGGGGIFELSGPDLGPAGANVSVYPRSGPWVGEAEALKLLDLFTKAIDVVHRDPAQIQSGTASEEVRVLVTLQGRDPGSDEMWDWAIYLVLWPSNVVLCSCNDRSPSTVPAAAVAHFATIAPVQRRQRRWFGRAR